MEIGDLYRMSEDHGHEIVPVKLVEAASFSVEDPAGHCYIAVSSDLSGAKKKVAVAHELGHCEYGGFYNYHSPYDIRSKAEARADRWAFQKLIPLDQLRDELSSGNDNLWDLAEEFGVTPEFLQRAIRFYVEQLGETLCQEQRDNT